MASAWMAAVASTSCSTASANAPGRPRQLLAERAEEHGLERGHVAGHIGGPRLAAAAQRRQRRRALRLLLGELVGIAVAVGDRIDDSLISSGSSRAICSVGSSRISSSDARSIRRTSHALASSSRERSRRARGPRIGVTAGSIVPVRKRRSRSVVIAEKIAARERPDHDRGGPRTGPGGRHPPRGRSGIAWRRARVVCWPRRCRARWPCRPSTAPRWTGSRWSRAAAELSVIGEARAGHPSGARFRAGQAVRISTGAVLPEGADAVVPVERTTAVKEAGAGDVLGSVPETGPGENVRRAGEDMPVDAVVLKPVRSSAPPSWASRRRWDGRARDARGARASPCW